MRKLILTAIAITIFAKASYAINSYFIEIAHDDEFFVINGEKFSAKTYCMGWQEGDQVIFTEGSPFGACASAELFNLNREEKCEVWCE